MYYRVFRKQNNEVVEMFLLFYFIFVSKIPKECGNVINKEQILKMLVFQPMTEAFKQRLSCVRFL
jgi:hypothetical protein